METILRAILDDDRVKVKKLLKADRRLATCVVDSARLYRAKIFHWIYAGDTALHLAAAGYRVELVRLLLAAGADPNSAMNHRQSGPLHYAADGYQDSPDWNAKRQVKTIRCLLDAGAEINVQDKNGAAPLHRAVRTRCAEAVKCLLEGGADVMLKNKSGSTAFHLAVQDTGRGGSGAEKARAAQHRIIRQFLSVGLNPALEDGKGKSVYDSARSGWIRDMLSDVRTIHRRGSQRSSDDSHHCQQAPRLRLGS
jgi:Ankyrin repeats (3 copies)/Ankyrin repeat